MSKFSGFHQGWISAAHVRLDQALHALSTYALPIVIGIISLLAMMTWDSHYPTSQAQQLGFRVIEDARANLTPSQAMQRLETRPQVQHHDTGLSEKPFWFTFHVLPVEGYDPVVIELSSRHSMETTCWDARTLLPLGSGNRNNTDGAISMVKAGFALALDLPWPDVKVVCRTSFVGPARLAVLQWPASELQISSEVFHRNSGLLDGGLILLSLFVLTTALMLREPTYILFAAWLIVNLRVGALSAGWDAQWLGRTVPYDWILQIRLLTIAIFYMLTITLFRTLFRDDLAKVGYGFLMRFAQWTCLPLLLLSVTLPYKAFLPFIWISTGISTVVLVFFLARILVLTRSSVALWYSASLGITLFASLYEVISAALGFKGLIGAVNSVTAALSSSLLAALAIAEQMRLEHNQRLEAQAELRHTYEAMPIGLFTLDLSGNFLSANPALATMLGPNVTSAGSNSWDRYFDEGALQQLLHLVQMRNDGELELRGKPWPDDEPRRFLVKATLARGKIEGSLQDVTERSKATEDLRFMANNDPLTKVLNRRGIEKTIDGALRQLAAGKPLALAYLDLDRFKLINDLYGHSVGDEVLKQVCERVNGMLGRRQQVGRVGGDEFVIVMADTTIPHAASICRGIVASIGTAPYRIGDKAFQVRGSIGVIEVSAGTLIKDAVATADRACREAKHGHGDGLVIYEKNASAFRERESELRLVECLAASTAPEGLFLEMQPIMSLRTPYESLNFEVLLRMRDTDGCVIPAGRIIAAAESSGRIGVIDRWVMSTTLAWLDAHHDHLTRTQFVCMNLSGASLNDERFVQDALVMLAQNVRAASHLCVEITESVALHDLHNTRRFIDKVRSYGVKVALDDFGAGYTSFSYLKELPADVLKIDGSFIVNINAHPANVAIVEAIVSLASSIGMKTIAEWAEDTATVQTLAEIGVDYVQGYVVARPQAPASMLAASSSADFIRDEELLRFLHDRDNETLPHPNLLDIIKLHKLH